MSNLDEPDPDVNEGLMEKFRVERLTPSSRGIDHSNCRYFVLDPRHDPIAFEALGMYATMARDAGFVPLADDLGKWLHEVRLEQAEERFRKEG